MPATIDLILAWLAAGQALPVLAAAVPCSQPLLTRTPDRDKHLLPAPWGWCLGRQPPPQPPAPASRLDIRQMCFTGTSCAHKKLVSFPQLTRG